MAAICAPPSFFRSYHRFSMAANRGAEPQHGALALSTSAPSFGIRARSHGSPSDRHEADLFLEKGEEVAHPSPPQSTCCFCGHCGRRGFLGVLSGFSFSAAAGESSAGDVSKTSPVLSPEARHTELPASRPGWYKELYAKFMENSMRSYEAEVAGYKEKLFAKLGQSSKILELGVGTGPNLKYYANMPGVDVFGVDPNDRMEKYAQAKALAAGLPSTNFNFIQGVAEALPIRDNSMDAVVGTLVLCSVKDVEATLKEVKRVLKPGGLYIFIEHVAAKDGSLLRFFQGILDPLQQFVADGCHLARETGEGISRAGFSDIQTNATSIPALSIISPHIYGYAYK